MSTEPERRINRGWVPRSLIHCWSKKKKTLVFFQSLNASEHANEINLATSAVFTLMFLAFRFHVSPEPLQMKMVTTIEKE